MSPKDGAGQAEGRIRLAYLDGIRAIAAIYVAVHHMWLGAWQEYPANAGPWWVGWLAYGHLAVAVFIVLSGFSLAIEPVRREGHLVGGARRFFRRRAWRILPTYWAALALSCLLLLVRDQQILGADGTVVGEQPVTAKGVVVHALLLQDVIGSETPNGAFWSIAIEWQIYFLFPLLLWWARRFGAAGLAVTVTLTVVGSQYLSLAIPLFAPLQNLVPQFLALFVFGMVGAEALRRTPSIRASRAMLSAAAAGAALFVAWAWSAGSAAVVEHYFWIDLGVGVLSVFLLAGLAHSRPNRFRSFLQVGFLRWTGRFSYSIYLVHAPILGVVWHFVVAPLRLPPVAAFLTILVLGTPGIILGSWLFARVFEEPFLRHRSLSALRDAFAARFRGGAVPGRGRSADVVPLRKDVLAAPED
ncbi:acyltransferase [Planomonospora sp. ID67723]|uniref:acyltransferase family protein n=1 Tax=Planomonospora sp. ID67723 TaxID=2738134 RepID=UPI0027DB509F|nr:acyltransferase [Planomonospora sp. ID67723]